MPVPLFVTAWVTVNGDEAVSVPLLVRLSSRVQPAEPSVALAPSALVNRPETVSCPAEVSVPVLFSAPPIEPVEPDAKPSVPAFDTSPELVSEPLTVALPVALLVSVARLRPAFTVVVPLLLSEWIVSLVPTT